MQVNAQGLLQTLAEQETGDLERLIVTTVFNSQQPQDTGQAIINQILCNAAMSTLSRRGRP